MTTAAPADGADAYSATSDPSAAERPRLASAPAWIAGLALVALFLLWAQKGGGYEETVWIPGALLVLGLLLAALIGAGGAVRLGRLQSLAVAALFGFAAWAGLSLLWAGDRGVAWTGANRAVLYACVFALFAVLPWTPRAAVACVWAFAAGVTAIAAYTVFHVATANDDSLFVAGKLSYPTGYANADVALFIAGFWVALALATRREQPILVRAAALGAVTFLPQVALIVQSRAAFVAVPLTAAIVLAVSPGRLRTMLGLAFALAPIVAGWNVHTEVFQEAEAGWAHLRPAMQSSAWFMAVTSAFAVLGGLAWGVADRRLTLTPRALHAVTVFAALVATFIVLLGAALVVRAHPIERLHTGWRQLTTTDIHYDKTRHYANLEGERWDIWRVAANRFLQHPVAGTGVDQFEVGYLKSRRTGDDPRYPHSLELGILSELGLVGAALFGTFVALALVLVRPRRSDEAMTQTVRVAALALFVYWLLHGSVEWFYEIPGLTAPVLAFAAMAGSLERSTVSRTPSRRRAWLVSTIAGIVALGCAASLVAPYLAARDLRRAVAVWARDPAASYRLLERARALNPLSDQPDLYAGAIAAKHDDRPRMRRYFAQALERNPSNWYAHLELGLTYSVDGRARAARAEVRRALALDPGEPVVSNVLERLEQGHTVEPRSLDPLFVRHVLARVR